MVKRFSAHVVFLPPDTVLKMHVIEVDENNRLQAVFPLEKEIAGTEFYSGGIVIVGKKGEMVSLYQSDNIELLTAKFRTSDGSSYGDIQRLC